MAANPAAARLTEAHRLAQARIGAQTVLALRPLWRILDPEDLDGSFEPWLMAVSRLVRAQRSTSAALGASYFQSFKALELGAGARAASVALDDRLPTEALATSMLVTGPVAVKRALAGGATAAAAMAHAESIAASAAFRHAMAGGRGTIAASVAADPQALGWARAASGGACAFCAMLAGRGPVYTGERKADFEAHDACGCSAEPVFRQDAPWPARSEQYAGLYAEAKAAEGDTVANLRRLLAAAP